MTMTAKLVVLAALLGGVLVLAIAVGNAKPGASRRILARAGATAFFAFLAAFFWLSPFSARGEFLTAMALFFSLGGTISVVKLVGSMQSRGAGEKSATH
ncbi:MAG TPA: hypothetical protein VII78_01735 [Myxococcota bacterium]|jgi:apolipoprotein N-acyltransferase